MDQSQGSHPCSIPRRRGDFNVGCRTYAMLQSAGVQDVTQCNAVLAMTGDSPYKRLPLQFANSLKDRILKSDRMSTEEFARCLTDVERIAGYPESVMTTFIVTLVAGRKAR